jgi:hypothetical protein
MKSIVKRVINNEWSSIQTDVEKLSAKKIKKRIDEKKIEVLARLNESNNFQKMDYIDVYEALSKKQRITMSDIANKFGNILSPNDFEINKLDENEKSFLIEIDALFNHNVMFLSNIVKMIKKLRDKENEHKFKLSLNKNVKNPFEDF